MAEPTGSPSGTETDTTTAEEVKPVVEPKVSRGSRKLSAMRRALERQRQERMDRLDRDIRSTELNQEKVNRQLREMMLQKQVPLFRREMETMWHHFEHTVDIKNHIIDLLREELDEDQVQTEYNLQASVEVVNDLISVLHQRLEDVDKRYKEQLKELLERGATRRVTYETMGKEDDEYLNMMLYAIEEIEKELTINYESEVVTKLDEERDKLKDIRRLMRGQLERIMEEVWDLYKLTFQRYDETTIDKRKGFLRLKQRDEKAADIIRRQMVHIQKLYDSSTTILRADLVSKFCGSTAQQQDTIRILREKVRNLQPQKVLSALIEERAFFLDAFCLLRSRLRKDKEHDWVQLITLTTESNESMKWLQKLISKGERILKLAAICRKRETQDEKITLAPDEEFRRTYEGTLVPLAPTIDLRESQPSTTLKEDLKLALEWEETDDNSEELTLRVTFGDSDTELRRKSDESMEGLEDEENKVSLAEKFPEFDCMKEFWKRIGNAYAQLLDLKKFRERLLEGNNLMRRKLQIYMLTINDGGHTAKRRKSRVKKGPPHNIIEASQEYKKMFK